nr:MAG TPA: hypothetical protein [Caudoviricetes sp.]
MRVFCSVDLVNIYTINILPLIVEFKHKKYITF